SPCPPCPSSRPARRRPSQRPPPRSRRCRPKPRRWPATARASTEKESPMTQMALEQLAERAAIGSVMRAVPSTVEVAKTDSGYTFRGVASTIGHVDRMNRCFLPGAFGTRSAKVPLLAYHDDTQPIGSSTLRPQGPQLVHESRLSRTKLHDETAT